MGLRAVIKRWLVNKALDRFELTDGVADFVIKPDGETVYLERWYAIPRNKWFNIYLHHFRRSDQDFALHDHPWLFNASLPIGDVGYREEVFVKKQPHWAAVPVTTLVPVPTNKFKFRWGKCPHRVQLCHDLDGAEIQAWTIFITGPVVRKWGFYCPKGWKPYQDVINHQPGIGSHLLGNSCD